MGLIIFRFGFSKKKWFTRFEDESDDDEWWSNSPRNAPKTNDIPQNALLPPVELFAKPSQTFFVRKNASIKLHPNAGAARGAWGRHWDLGPSAGLGGDGAGEGPGPPAGPSVGPVAIRGAWGGMGCPMGTGLGSISSMGMCTDRDKGIRARMSSRCGPNRNDMS